MTYIQHLNEYLKIIGEREFSDDGRYQWDSYSKSAKSYYTKRFRDILTKLITIIFPKNAEEVVKNLLVSEENQKMTPSIIPKEHLDHWFMHIKLQKHGITDGKFSLILRKLYHSKKQNPFYQT